MKKEMRKGIIGIVLMVMLFGGSWAFKKFNFNSKYEVGQKLDSLNGVYVYYNGGVNNVTERNTSPDGYNLGLKYQCVEFVKRYYYQYYKHKMPDAYGHAKTFFDESLADSSFNNSRGLLQFSNPSQSRPAESDLVIYSGTFLNKYGHVAIVSKVTATSVEIIQQNPGPFGTSRETYDLKYVDGKWKIDNSRIKGWLRMPIAETSAATASEAPDTITVTTMDKLKSIMLDVDGDKHNDIATYKGLDK
jgi:surface antigen